MSRIKNSIKNIKYAIIGQGFALIISFIARVAFVRILSAEYLGLNGLFSNILSILSLADLGVGSAINYSIYKPLAERDIGKLKALMKLYKRAYISIGMFIIILGSILTPFLEYFIKEMPDIPYIKLIYLMFVLNSGISYFFSYKRSLIIADQKRYISDMYRYGFYFLLNVTQIIILIISKNYILYLGLQLISTLFENMLISKRVDKLYPFLNNENIETLNNEEKKGIISNIKAMMFHRIGGVIVKGTDNLLISKFVGVISVGIYSNYTLITHALDTVFGLTFQAVTASIGNLGVTEGYEKREFVFKCINLINFWIYAFASICLIILFNPFIEIWLGKEYLFPMPIVLIIVLSFYLSGMRKSVLTFRDALGLFWYDRYKPIFEATINLIASIILAQYIGIAGIFIGTIISTLTTCFWIEPYVLYKYGFNSSNKSYFMRYSINTILMFLVGILTRFITNLFLDHTLLGFISKLIVCAIVPNVLFLIVFWKTKEFQYLFNILKSLIIKFFRNYKGKQDIQAENSRVHADK